jgi:hypothetical protein
LVDSKLSKRAVRIAFSKEVVEVMRRRMRNNESEGLGLDTNNQKWEDIGKTVELVLGTKAGKHKKFVIMKEI